MLLANWGVGYARSLARSTLVQLVRFLATSYQFIQTQAPRPASMIQLLTSRTPRKSLSQRTSSHDFRPSNLERPENHFVVKQTTVAAAQQVDNLLNSQIIMSHLLAMRK
jgi:hypothetical protein